MTLSLAHAAIIGLLPLECQLDPIADCSCGYIMTSPAEIAETLFPKTPTMEAIEDGPVHASPVTPFAYYGPGAAPGSASPFHAGSFGGFGSGGSRAVSVAGSTAYSYAGVSVAVTIGDGLHRPVDRPDEPEIAPVPLPAGVWLLLGALGLLWGMRR